jgi:uncharacterized protein with GYD domain
MATFITLVKLTDEGAKNLRNLPALAQANRERAEGLGIKVQGWYLTQGEYDIVVVAEAPDAETMLAQAVGVSGTGNARTQTLRAYTVDELQQVLQKLG